MKLFAGIGAGNPVLNFGGVAVVLSAAFVGLFGRIQTSAETADQTAEIVKFLSGPSQNVIARLTALNQLPADQWRFHTGDLAHGESPDLDDSSWQVVKPRMEAPQDAVWFRRWIEVPQSLNGYDLVGTRIWFSFAATGNGPMPEIIYFNGRRVALGDNLKPILIPRHYSKRSGNGACSKEVTLKETWVADLYRRVGRDCVSSVN